MTTVELESVKLLLGADYIRPINSVTTTCEVVGGKTKRTRRETWADDRESRWVGIQKGEFFIIGYSDYKGDYDKEEIISLSELAERIEATKKSSAHVNVVIEQPSINESEPIAYVMHGKVFQTWDDVWNDDDFDNSHRLCYSEADIKRFIQNYNDSKECGYFE